MWILPADRIWLQTWMHRNSSLIAEEGIYPFLQEMQCGRFLHRPGENGEVRADRRLMLCRAVPEHPDQWLVNRLLARLAPFDFVSASSLTSRAFTKLMKVIPKAIALMLWMCCRKTYLNNKAALRARLYGLKGNQDDA
jgi:hypothetical protein